MNAGDTYLFPSADKHLWVVISEPSFDPQQVVVVMLASWKPHCDQDCILEIGDHPFVRHRTCVEYHRATIETDATLEHAKRRGLLIPKDPASTVLLQRIRQACQDADMRNDCREALRIQGIIE